MLPALSLPHYSTFRVVDVVNLIEYDPFNIADQIRPSIEHAATSKYMSYTAKNRTTPFGLGLPTQDLCCHDNTRGVISVDLHVTRDQTNILSSKFEAEVAKLLVAEGLVKKDQRNISE
jgi:hypothetical protein